MTGEPRRKVKGCAKTSQWFAIKVEEGENMHSTDAVGEGGAVPGASLALQPGSIITLKGGGTGKFCRVPAKGVSTVCDESKSASTSFEVVDAGEGFIGLKAGGCWSNGQRIPCTTNHLKKIVAVPASPQVEFKVSSQGEFITLQLKKNGKYCSDSGKGGQIQCNSNSITKAERWTVACQHKCKKSAVSSAEPEKVSAKVKSVKTCAESLRKLGEARSRLARLRTAVAELKQQAIELARNVKPKPPLTPSAKAPVSIAVLNEMHSNSKLDLIQVWTQPCVTMQTCNGCGGFRKPPARFFVGGLSEHGGRLYKEGGTMPLLSRFISNPYSLTLTI